MFSDHYYDKKARKWARFLGRLPGVVAIFLSGSLAQGKGTEKSDIDFFIITRPGRIWIARFFVFLILKCFGQLAKEHHHAGKICPNHFIISTHLEIREQDAYAAHLFSKVKPLYDPKNIYSIFMEENRHWMEKLSTKKLPFDKNKRDRSEFINPKKGFLEKYLRNIQIKKIKRNPEYHLPGAKIILTDTELRFHPKPKNVDFRL